MSRENYELAGTRLSRGGSLFGADPQVQLRTALRSNDLPTFRRLLGYGAVDPDHCYPYPDYKTCLDLAASEPNRAEYVKLLLQHEVDVNRVNETHAAAPIHFAVQGGNLEALRTILEDERVDVNIKSKGNSALLLAVKQIEDLDQERDSQIELYENMIELLLKAGCDVNAPDAKGVTPVYSAAKQGLERVIKLMIDYSKTPVDLDTYKDRRQKTARKLLEDCFPHLLSRFDAMSEPAGTIDENKLFNYLSRHEEDDFIRDFAKVEKNNAHRPMLVANNGLSTMLQMATDKGLDKIVSTLLNAGADPNATCPANDMTSIAIACQNGFYKILKILAENENTLFEAVNGESLLQITTKSMKNKNDDPKTQYAECLDFLLDHPKIKVNVNFCDMKDNTALHYAARNGDHETVLALLRNGACIGMRNKFNEPPLADIQPKTLETYLDECLTTNGERPSDDDYEIHMNYKFLVYPNKSVENDMCKPLMGNANNNNSNTTDYGAILAPETDALLYMAHNEDLRPLLKHPVITSFLYLKWERISWLFYSNITFYSLFWLCLILYILVGYGPEGEQGQYIAAVSIVTRAATIMGLILLIFRETFQLIMSPRRYLTSLENWLEMLLIFVTAWIVFYDAASENTKQQLSAVAILLSSAELVLLIGQFPSLSTYIVMLRTVSWNFFKFLLWYCILIIAFALSFYTLFRKVNPERVAPDPNNDGEEDFFLDPGKSLFKTIVMLTGEFDAGSIKFGMFPVTSHLIFIVFVFMVPIVLFNLLNGLAVSDTQAIKENAELVGIVSRIRLISYFESVFIGYVKPNGPSNINCMTYKVFCISPLVKRICLFPYFLPKYRIIVKPNQENKVVIPHAEALGKFGDDAEEDVEGGLCILQQCHTYQMDRKIIKSAKAVLSKKNALTEFAQVHNSLAECERKIDRLESSVKKLIQIIESSKKG